MLRYADTRRKLGGQNLVEFALVTPVFLLLLMGLLEGGRLIYYYNTVNHAAQEAARVGVLANTSSVGQVKDEAVNAATPLSLNTANVTVEVNGGATSFSDRTIGDRLAVSVGHDFTPVVAMVFGSAATIHVSGSSELMVE
jgi:Flp pilus assembly protein TadG